MSTAAITLPGGFWLDGAHHRDAALRPLTGEDEAFLLDSAALPPARRTTLLLARCLARLGPWEPVPADAVRALTVGDREALLLHLRRLSLGGDRVSCVLCCPAPSCGERMDLDLAMDDLLEPPYAGAAPWHDAVFSEGGASWRVRFRLPTGADQEEAAPLVATDAGAAAMLILRRCIESVEREDGGPTEPIPPAVAAGLADRMASLDPQAELALQLTCPACGRDFSSQLDAAAYFFQELAGGAAGLWREVHFLAFYYHWSEAEILCLSGGKRRLYLGLLAETLGGERGR
jgi:hypothetical protein